MGPATLVTRRTFYQACHAAYDQTDETAVYNCTGNPHPQDIDEIMQTMMRDSFEVAYQRELLTLAPQRARARPC